MLTSEREADAIVVGAGPSGATAAMALAQKGRRVLLLDRQEFPRDKACGDGVPSMAIAQLFELGMEPILKDAGFYPVHWLSVISPSGHEVKAELKEYVRGACSYVVPRLTFDQTLVEHAKASGARLRIAQVTAPVFKNGQVVGVQARQNGKSMEFRAGVVIAADGVTSVIARALQPDRFEDRHRAVALRAYVEGMDVRPNEVEFYLDKRIIPGYAWIFPYGATEANVGLGMRLDRFHSQDKKLPELLDLFMELPAVKTRLRPGWQLRDVAVWQLNFGSQNGLQNVSDGLVVIGDAAGHINPLTGGGIANGIVAGRLAADVVDKGLAKGDMSRQVLQEYEELCRDAMDASMRRSYMFQRSLASYPLIVDWLVRLAGSRSGIAKTVGKML